MMKKIIAPLLILLFVSLLTGPVLAADLSEPDYSDIQKLVLRANVKQVLPGGEVTFTLTSPVPVQGVLLFGKEPDGDIHSYEMKKSGKSFTCKAKMPEDFSGEMSFDAFSAESALVSKKLFILVKPDPQKISMLTFRDGISRSLPEGMTFSQSLKGSSKDGREYELSNPKLGTKYTSSNPSVAIILPDGSIRTLKPGETKITARYGNCGAIVHLTVFRREALPKP